MRSTVTIGAAALATAVGLVFGAGPAAAQPPDTTATTTEPTTESAPEPTTPNTFEAVENAPEGGAESTEAAPEAGPANPDGGHVVRYSVSTGQEATVSLYYLAVQPESQATYDADPNAYLRHERINVVPGAPWTFETTLTDTSWAYISAGGAARYNGTPNPHCEITIDGQPAVDQQGETSAVCALKPW